MSISQRTPLQHFGEALPVALYATDPDGLLICFNQAASDLAGRPPEIGRDRWCVTWRLHSPDGRPMQHEDYPMSLALRQNRAIRGSIAIAERPDGTRFAFTPYPTPIHDARGDVTGGINMLVVITDQPRIVSLGKNLMSEPNRKIATIVSLVDHVFDQAYRRADDGDLQPTVMRIGQHLAAISSAQTVLHGGADETPIGSWEVLSAACLAASPAMHNGVALQCEAVAGDLSIETAMPLALIAQELIANAVRHGGNERSKVAVDVSLRKQDGCYVLTVEDDGPGFSLAPSPTSFGLGLVTAVAEQLNALLELNSGPRTRCIVRFPADRTVH